METTYFSTEDKSTQRGQISNKAAHYCHIVRILDLENQHGDLDHLKNLINCSLYHCRAILEILSTSAHNVLSNGRISDWTASMVIRIATEL